MCANYFQQFFSSFSGNTEYKKHTFRVAKNALFHPSKLKKKMEIPKHFETFRIVSIYVNRYAKDYFRFAN